MIGFNKNIKLNKLTEIFSLSYNYFPLDIILNICIPFYSSGEINKVISNKGTDYIYAINCTNYSGASGCPIFDKQNNSLVGIMFENISYETEKGKIEIGTACQCISRDIISLVIKNIDKSQDVYIDYLINLYVFKEKLNNLFEKEIRVKF